MSKQWKDKTRGGDPVENVRPNNCSMWKWAGEVVSPDGGRSTLTWTGRGYHGADEHPRKDDLIPIEPEAPSPAKARVDLALAAWEYKLASDATQAAMERWSEAELKFREAMKACGKDNAVVSIHGALFLFQIDKDGCIFVEGTEVL
jgi:hypothetical protein